MTYCRMSLFHYSLTRHSDINPFITSFKKWFYVLVAFQTSQINQSSSFHKLIDW